MKTTGRPDGGGGHRCRVSYTVVGGGQGAEDQAGSSLVPILRVPLAVRCS